MPQREITREEKLERLVDHLMDEIRQDSTDTVLRSIVRRGFMGFQNMSEARLDSELRLRGPTSAPPERQQVDDANEGMSEDISDLRPIGDGYTE
jgi:hypothetical protein